jgi:hypothetical protein
MTGEGCIFCRFKVHPFDDKGFGATLNLGLELPQGDELSIASTCFKLIVVNAIELRRYQTSLCVQYEGHTGRVAGRVAEEDPDP